MKITVEQLGSLRKTDPVLYGHVLPAAHGVDGTTVEIDISKIDRLHAKLLEIWAKENGIQSEPAQHEKYCGCEDCFRKHVAENNDKEKQRLALAAQTKAAAARLTQYLQGDVTGFGRLRDSEHNRQQWAAFELKLPADVVLSADLIDQFVSGWRIVLEWDAPSAPAPEPPAPEVFLADGSRQKPLDETPSNTWTKAQLQDWFVRNDGQKKLRDQQFGGGSRSTFFKPDSQVV